MNIYHKRLSTRKWTKLSLEERMANIGSEVFRALSWREKGHREYADSANYRALELFDLTLDCSTRASELKEIARCRELWLDFFVGDNQYHQNSDQWKKYFLAFNYAAGVRRK